MEAEAPLATIPRSILEAEPPLATTRTTTMEPESAMEVQPMRRLQLERPSLETKSERR